MGRYSFELVTYGDQLVMSYGNERHLITRRKTRLSQSDIMEHLVSEHSHFKTLHSCKTRLERTVYPKNK
jgi:hypothetical protein